MKGTFLIYFFAALALSVPGCEGTTNSTAPDQDGGESPAVAPVDTTTTGLKGPGTADEYDADAKARMSAAWRAFKDDSPQWPRLRQEWITLGRRATSTLVENLYLVMLISSTRNYSEGYERSRGELILLGELALPTLAGVLEKGTIYSPEDRKDLLMPTGMVTITAEIMALTGKNSVPYLAKLTKSDRATIRRSACTGLGKTGARTAVAPLVKVLADAAEWADRMVAAGALGRLKFPASEAGLVRALEDPVADVIEVAARSLAQQRATGALPALDDRRKRAQAAGQHQISASVGAAARLIRGGR